MKANLPLNLGGIGDFNKWLEGKSIQAIHFPENHTITEAWLLWILLDSGESMEFSSSFTMVNDWHEYGSLNCKVAAFNEHKLAITSCGICAGDINASSEKLVFENEEVRTECGIIFHLQDSTQLIVACGISPGSVSVLLPRGENKFSPQFGLASCIEETI